MSAHMANAFYDTLTVLDVLSASSGMTVGEIRKIMTILSLGQTKRLVESLVMCGFVHSEIKPHGRTGKTIYHFNENAAVMLSSISRQYMEKIS